MAYYFSNQTSSTTGHCAFLDDYCAIAREFGNVPGCALKCRQVASRASTPSRLFGGCIDGEEDKVCAANTCHRVCREEQVSLAALSSSSVASTVRDASITREAYNGFETRFVNGQVC